MSELKRSRQITKQELRSVYNKMLKNNRVEGYIALNDDNVFDFYDSEPSFEWTCKIDLENIQYSLNNIPDDK